MKKILGPTVPQGALLAGVSSPLMLQKNLEELKKEQRSGYSILVREGIYRLTRHNCERCSSILLGMAEMLAFTHDYNERGARTGLGHLRQSTGRLARDFAPNTVRVVPSSFAGEDLEEFAATSFREDREASMPPSGSRSSSASSSPCSTEMKMRRRSSTATALSSGRVSCPRCARWRLSEHPRGSR